MLKAEPGERRRTCGQRRGKVNKRATGLARRVDEPVGKSRTEVSTVLGHGSYSARTKVANVLQA